MVHTIEHETVHEQELCIEMVNIKSVSFISNHSTIIANLKSSSNKATMAVPYKVDMGTVGKIIPFNVFTKLFPSTTTDQLVATRNVTKLRTYNHTIKQLGGCKVEIENSNKCKKAFSL